MRSRLADELPKRNIGRCLAGSTGFRKSERAPVYLSAAMNRPDLRSSTCSSPVATSKYAPCSAICPMSQPLQPQGNVSVRTARTGAMRNGRKSGCRGGLHPAFGNAKPLHRGSNAITLGPDDRMAAGVVLVPGGEREARRLAEILGDQGAGLAFVL